MTRIDRLAAALEAYSAYVNCQHDDDARCEHWKAALEAERNLPDDAAMFTVEELAEALHATDCGCEVWPTVSAIHAQTYLDKAAAIIEARRAAK